MSRATDVRVICRACGARRPIQRVFGKNNWRNLPRCRGRHPHLQRFDGACDEMERVAPISNDAAVRWLPAAQTRGEGILIRVREDRVTKWENEYEAGERYGELVAAHEAWRARRGLAAGVAVPGRGSCSCTHSPTC